MSKRTEAEMEARYDAERDGSAYIKPAPESIRDWIDRRLADEQAPSFIGAVLEYLSDAESRAIDILLTPEQADEQAIADWIDRELE
jgi:hypothetical protein